MARPKSFSDDRLRHYVELGFDNVEIARFLNVTESAVSQRRKVLDLRSKARERPNLENSFVSLWEAREAAEANYARCLAELEQCFETQDKVKVLALILKHIEVGVSLQATLFSVEETKLFIDDVLAELDNGDPDLKERVIARLRDRRTLRTSFVAGTLEQPGQ